MTTRTVQLLAIAISMTISGVSGAYAYSDRVKDACAGDYQDFCSQYLPDSTELRRCFESNRKGLSRRCIDALIDSGEVPQKYLKKS